MEILIKKATISDLNKIQELNLKLFEKEHKEYDSTLNKNWTFSETGKNYFLNRIQEGFVAIAEIDKKAVGYIVGGEGKTTSYRTIERIAELDNMLILEEHRKKGIGTQLVNIFLEWCKNNGINHIRVDASAKNQEAINFYKKLGFEDYIIILEKKT